MIKFPDSHTEHVTIKDCTKGKYGFKCPKCETHKDPKDTDEILGDCKTLIYQDKLDSNGKLVLRCQCMCYSKEHWREE